MEILFEYDENEYLPISTISVIGNFNDYNPQRGKMAKCDNTWKLSYDIEPGEHRYKFLINNNLKLNDPMANIYLPDENEELWSVIMVNDKNERLYNNTQYTVHIDKYNITSIINDDLNAVNKKNFNILLDEKVVTRFDFTNVTGLHTVTTAWYSPRGDLFQTTENNLFKPTEDDKPIRMWFWMDLKNNTQKYPYGIWKIKLFIDGEFILEDQFNLSEANGYSSKGKILY